MLVKDVLKKIGIESEDNRIVKGVTFDSRNVEDGFIFVAYKGDKVDGNDFIHQAFSNGAVCVVSDRLVGYDIYKSNNIELAKQKLCKIVYIINLKSAVTKNYNRCFVISCVLPVFFVHTDMNNRRMKEHFVNFLDKVLCYLVIFGC